VVYLTSLCKMRPKRSTAIDNFSFVLFCWNRKFLRVTFIPRSSPLKSRLHFHNPCTFNPFARQSPVWFTFKSYSGSVLCLNNICVRKQGRSWQVSSYVQIYRPIRFSSQLSELSCGIWGHETRGNAGEEKNI